MTIQAETAEAGARGGEEAPREVSATPGTDQDTMRPRRHVRDFSCSAHTWKSSQGMPRHSRLQGGASHASPATQGSPSLWPGASGCLASPALALIPTAGRLGSLQPLRLHSSATKPTILLEADT